MRIIVLCNGNSCRSQLVEAYLQLLLGDDAQVYSAGISPKPIHPLTFQVLTEDGIDWSTKTSKSLSLFDHEQFDIILTVCDSTYESCPLFSGSGKRIHHSFPDPDHVSLSPEDSLQEFRNLRDEIKGFCVDFVKQLSN